MPSARSLLLLSLLTVACAPVRTPVPVQKELTPASSNLSSPAAVAAPRVDFDSQVRPILEARCQPCHFPGGTMYERLPFDEPRTIHHLGEKLFSRIREEREQTVLRSFLAQEP